MIWIPCVSLGGDITSACMSLLSSQTSGTFEFSVFLKEYVPFGEERLGMLNDLLKHMCFRISEGENEASVSILSDEEKVFGLSKWTENGSENFCFSFEPDTAYTGGTVQDLTGAPSVQASMLSFDLPPLLTADKISWADAGYDLLEKLPDVFPEYTRSQEVKTRLKDVGMSTRKAVITIPQNDVRDNIMSRLGDRTEEKTLREFLHSLTFTGRQQFTLYYDENGQLMKANYSGQAGRTEDMRKLNVEWRGKRGNEIFDDLTVKAPPVNGKNRDTLTIKRTEIRAEEDTLQASLEWTRIRNRVKTILNGTADLSLKNKGTVLSGTIVLTSEKDELVTGFSASPDLTLNPETGWEGSVGIRYLSGKNAVIDAEIKAKGFAFSESPVERPEKILTLNDMSEKERADLSGRIQRQIASTLLKALLSLPKEDLRFLNYEMNDELWQQVLQKAIPSSEGGLD